jgi:1-deoxy-D-xylulose-5-phosphate reductoisomerase
MEKRIITVLGATGSIGIQALDVISCISDLFEINYLTTNTNIDVLEKLCLRYNPKGVVIADESAYKKFKVTTSFRGEILAGDENLIFAATHHKNDLLLSALVGFSGVKPTLAAIQRGITVALANKETLVSAGAIIMKESKKFNTSILAVDSEHSAILQCIVGESKEQIEKIILTASGGPFRNTALENFSDITLQQALKHPNWTMGSKITIDSATMMNKGFEVIEAGWLFDMSRDKIDVVIHPQSIIHSLVQFVDGSIKAQLGLPDMRIPISYALTYPERFSYDFPRLDLVKISRFDFFEPELKRYPCLELAYTAMDKSGNMPAVLNAANEICVAGFLNEKIKFTQISDFIERIMTNFNFIQNPTIEDIIQSDLETRILTKEIINK